LKLYSLGTQEDAGADEKGVRVLGNTGLVFKECTKGKGTKKEEVILGRGKRE